MNINSLTIQGGFHKDGKPEHASVTVYAGQTCCLVGPTGAGKSRLLADIEWLAQGDTSSGRHILLNDKNPDAEMRSGLQGKLVAQITQNMNFVLDMQVMEFICLHAESQGSSHPEQDARLVIQRANQLCGESFQEQTPLTFLSGGQSRALMISDVAYLGESPIVLIDEIENAGIDKLAALHLFSHQGKIVFLASHDPLLILQADFRMIIHNGGITRIINPSPQEQNILQNLYEWENQQNQIRQQLRQGKILA